MRWLYPRKLYHRIAVLISIVIAAVFFTFGSLTARRQTEFLQSIVMESNTRMTQALAESCIRYLLISDYAGLDELLKKFITMSDSLQIRVYRDEGKLLSEVSKESAASPPVRSSGKITAQVPDGTSQQIIVTGDRMMIWQPVVSLKVIGWVCITYSLKNIDDLRRNVWIDTGKAAIFWTFFSIIFLMFIFNPLASAIQKLSDFARQLTSRKGDQIEIRRSSYEIEQLCQSLNYASVDLYAKEQELISYRLHLEELVAKRTVKLQKEILERRKIEEVLKVSEERLRTLINATPDIVCFKDGEGRWLEANAADLELFELNGVDYRGRKDSELAGFSDFYRASFLTCEATDERTWQTQAPTRGDETIPRPDGTAKVFDVIKVPLFHKDNKRKGLVVLGRDITDRMQLEQRLHRAQKAESLGRMAGAIAHHFNNKLYAVMGRLEMAMDDLPRGVDISETLAKAQKAAHEAAEVSRMMLTYLGQTPGKHEPIDLSEAYRQYVTLLQAAAPKGMILNVDFPSSGPIINADAGQMQQILTSLVTNAWETIIDNRGPIGLALKTVSHEDIPPSNRFPIDWQPQEIDYACLEVSDTGGGIANKDIEKIFDPFFTTKFTGRGLGLPVVLGIVKSHGGGITVESELGQGSTFRIFLPVSTEKLPLQHDLSAMPEAQPTSKAEELSKIEGGGTVLLIEDDEPVRNMARMMLTRLGYKVLDARDGAEAVEIFQKHPDEIIFVLSDLTMPRMDGWETLAALRKLSPDIPVVLSSGYDKAQVMAGDHTEQPDAFLGKPYQLKGLRETINRVLAARVHL